MQTKTKREKIKKNIVVLLSLPTQLNRVSILIKHIIVTKIMWSLDTVFDILNSKSSLYVFFCRLRKNSRPFSFCSRQILEGWVTQR